jgi:hypothetical protein
MSEVSRPNITGRPLPFEPPGLRELVDSIDYKPGWSASLDLFAEDQEIRGWAFYVISDTADSYQPSRQIRVRHEFLVPPASWNRATWAAWIRDRYADVEAHELGEFLRFDGVRAFAPHHGNGEDPYRVWHVGDYADTRVKAGQDKPVHCSGCEGPPACGDYPEPNLPDPGRGHER